MAYLDLHPPARSQFRCPRRQDVSGVAVVHTAENIMDTVGPDTGAEAVARYISERSTPGSYHDLVDSSGPLAVVRWSCEAYHDATGSNPHSYGLSFACRTTDWAAMPAGKRAQFLEHGAEAAEAWARWVYSTTGIVVPARRISRDQSEMRVPGFLSHGQRDPDRRTDPGAGFPWTDFLHRFATRMGYVTPPDPGDDDEMATAPCSLWRFAGKDAVYRVAADGQSAQHVGAPDVLAFDQALLRLGGFGDAINIARKPAKPGDHDTDQWLRGILAAPGSLKVAPA